MGHVGILVLYQRPCLSSSRISKCKTDYFSSILSMGFVVTVRFILAKTLNFLSALVIVSCKIFD